MYAIFEVSTCNSSCSFLPIDVIIADVKGEYREEKKGGKKEVRKNEERDKDRSIRLIHF